MQDLFGFLLLGSILLFIVGMVKPSLVIRWGAEDKRGRKQVAVTYLGLMIFSFVAFGMASPSKPSDTPKQEVKPAQSQTAPQPTQQQVNKPSTSTQEDLKKQQQEAYINWYAGLEIQLKKFDNSSKVWAETFAALGEGRIGRHQAYSQLKPMQNDMENFMMVFNKMEPPMALSKDHQKALREGTQELSTMAYSRKKAVEKALQFIDDMKPSSMQEARDQAQLAQSIMLRGIAKIVGVRAELGLIEQKTQ